MLCRFIILLAFSVSVKWVSRLYFVSPAIYVGACGNWPGLRLWQPLDRGNVHHLTLHLFTYHLCSRRAGLCCGHGFRWEDHSAVSSAVQFVVQKHLNWICNSLRQRSTNKDYFFAGLALAAPFEDIYFGLWGYNCVLACIAIGGMFYALTWQVHLLAIVCGK